MKTKFNLSAISMLLTALMFAACGGGGSSSGGGGTSIGWHHPSGLSDNISPDGTSTLSPIVAMDNKGNAIVVWSQSNTENRQLYKSEYRDGVWTHPSDLTDNISRDGYAVEGYSAAMDNNGNAIIVWYQSNGSNYQIFKSEYRGGAWDHPNSLNDNISPDGYDAIGPNVAMEDNGNAIIVWQQRDGDFQIFKSEYRSGVWTHPGGLAINTSPNGQDAQYASVAMDNNGNAVIVWEQSDGNDLQVFKSEYRDGAWDHPNNLLDNISPDGQNARSPDVAMDNNGNAIIIWQQYNDNDSINQVFKSEYRNGSWIHPSGLNDFFNPDPDGQGISNANVAMDNNGNAIIIWYQSDGANNQVFKSEYRNSAWTHPTGLSDNISPDGQPVHGSINVAMSDPGTAIIVWPQSVDASLRQVFISEYY